MSITGVLMNNESLEIWILYRVAKLIASHLKIGVKDSFVLLLTGLLSKVIPKEFAYISLL